MGDLQTEIQVMHIKLYKIFKKLIDIKLVILFASSYLFWCTFINWGRIKNLNTLFCIISSRFIHDPSIPKRAKFIKTLTRRWYFYSYGFKHQIFVFCSVDMFNIKHDRRSSTNMADALTLSRNVKREFMLRLRIFGLVSSSAVETRIMKEVNELYTVRPATLSIFELSRPVDDFNLGGKR